MLNKPELFTYQEKPRFPLEIRTSAPLYIRHESVKLGLGGQSYKLLFASDLHFCGKPSLRAINQLIEATQETQPDLLLLGGDLVDIPPGIPFLQDCVEELSKITPVWAISGNHDQWFNLFKVKEAVITGNGKWLEDESVLLEIGLETHSESNQNQPYFSFGKDVQLKVSTAVNHQNPKTLQIDGYIHQQTLLSNIKLNNIKILCAHNPIVFPEAVKAGYKLIFAGHLHGCQWIFTENQGLFYPGAWFYRWNGRRFTLDDATLLVSRGVGDTLPIRWNCPREVILCKIY